MAPVILCQWFDGYQNQQNGNIRISLLLPDSSGMANVGPPAPTWRLSATIRTLGAATWAKAIGKNVLRC